MVMKRNRRPSPIRTRFWVQLSRDMPKEFWLPPLSPQYRPRRDADVMIIESSAAIPVQASSINTRLDSSVPARRGATQGNISIPYSNNIHKKVRPNRLQLENRSSFIQQQNPVSMMSKNHWIDLTKDEDSSTVCPRSYSKPTDLSLMNNSHSSASTSRFSNQPALSSNSDTHLANRNHPVMGNRSSVFNDLASAASLNSKSNFSPGKSAMNTSLLREPFFSDSKNKNKQPLGLPNVPYGTNNLLPVKQEGSPYPSSSYSANSANPRGFVQASHLPGTMQNPIRLSGVGSSNFVPPVGQQNNELRSNSSIANRFNAMSIKSEPYDGMFNYGNREHMRSNIAVRNAERSSNEYMNGRSTGLTLAESSRPRQNMLSSNQPMVPPNTYGFNVKSIKCEPYDPMFNYGNQGNMATSSAGGRRGNLPYAESSRSQMVFNNEPMANHSNAYGFNVSIKSEPYDHMLNYGNQGQMPSRLEAARRTGLPDRNQNMIANSSTWGMTSPLHEVIESATNPRRNRSSFNMGKGVWVDLTLDSP